MAHFNDLAYSSANELIFGKCLHPLKCGRNLIIGEGAVFPEINFTLPAMYVDDSTWPDVLKNYSEIAEFIVKRAHILKLPGLVVEFEQLPPMTLNPQWGAEITSLLKNRLEQLYENDGIANALRVTVVDLRDGQRPPLLRQGKYWEKTREAFICAAQAGADILSIESVGGKEVHDQALMYGDLNGIVSSLGILACKDMVWLWDEIVAIAHEYGAVPGGDTACGFANTAMQLAGKGMLPSILAAVDRAATVPRSLVAYEQGAIGPSKDCAYEGPAIKAITGFPISMEGRSACCAHFSPLGNIAGAVTDLWSNESVQNIRLLSGNAPEAFLELLAYDCRLYNTALAQNKADAYRDLLIESDRRLSCEALMLDPAVVFRLAKTVVGEENHYNRTLAVVRQALLEIHNAVHERQLSLNDSEQNWLDRMEKDCQGITGNEGEALDILMANYGNLFDAREYGVGVT